MEDKKVKNKKDKSKKKVTALTDEAKRVEEVKQAEKQLLKDAKKALINEFSYLTICAYFAHGFPA